MHREIICLWQIAFGAQSEQALQRVRGWGDEVGVPTLLFHFIEMNAIRLRDKTRNNKNEISEMCHESDEPIYITKNGYGDMVIMSMENYEATIKMLNIYKELESSEQQILEGRTKDARSSLSSMRSKYNL